MKTKRLITASVLVLGAALTGWSFDGPQYRAGIPEPFAIGSKALPAGSYEVTQLTNECFLFRHIESRDSALLVTSIPLGYNKAEPRIVLRRYGDTLRVKEIWGTTMGGARARSAAEKALDQERGPGSVLLLPLHRIK